MRKETNFFPALTGIRAVAAWLVFFHHFNPFSEAVFGTRIHNFFAESYIGVTMFFVLSGLLITLRYYDRDLKQPNAFYNYMVKRFARIYPVFFLVITVNFIWLLYTGVFTNTFSGGWVYYAGTLTFLRGFFANFSEIFVAQSWSLTPEECFYLSCPFIFYFVKKKRQNLFFIPVLLITTGVLLTLFFMKHPFYGLFRDMRFLFNYTFFGRCAEFFIGIVLALYIKKRPVEAHRGFIFTVIGTAFIIASMFCLSLLRDGRYGGDHHPAGIFINNFILPLFGIAVLYYGLVTEKNIFSKWLGSKWMIVFGKSSYIFYLIHMGVVTTLIVNNVSAKPIISFLILNVLSVLLYHLYEHPMNSFVRRKFLRKEPPVSSSKTEDLKIVGF